MVTNFRHLSTPVISDISVRQALERLRSGSLYRIGSKPSSRATDDAVCLLGGLALVTRFLETPGLPNIHPEYILGYAVDSVLTLHIIHHYTRLRTIFGLSPPNLDANLDECERCIAEDAANRTGSERLLAWSWLYHRYVRAELNISSPLFAKHISRDRRSLLRYRQVTLDILVRSLTEAEQTVQDQNRNFRLLAAIPGVPDPVFYGRDHLINWIDSRIAIGRPAHFVITGGPGTGKTEFVQAAARRWVSNPKFPGFFEIIWIHDPPNTQSIYHRICERLNQTLAHDIQSERNALVELRAYLHKYPVLIVVDSLDFVETPAEVANEIVTTLGTATICLISRSNLVVNVPVEMIVMRDLDQDEIRQFCLGKTDLDANSAAELASELKLQVGGNPLAIKLALDNYADVDHAIQLTYSDILTRLFHVKFERLEPAIQRLWCACALLPDHGMALDDLTAIWPSYSFGAISTLLSHHILRKMPGNVLVIETSARRYIRALYDEPDGYTIRKALDDVIHHLVQAITSGEANALPVAEHILRVGWPTVPPEIPQHWFDTMLKRPNALSQQTFEVMQSLHGTLHGAQLMMSPGALMTYGVGLRRRGQWAEAEQVFIEAATMAGRQGEFQHHARSFLELAILLLHSGNFQQAKQMLSRAEATAKRYNLQDELERIHLEYAQIAIDRNDAEQALDILYGLPDSGRSLALRAESYLLIGSIADGIDAAMRALRYLAYDSTNLCRLQILIGRLRLAEGRYGVAEAYFSAAITGFEAQGDLFALARARANLGAVLTHLQKFHRAKVELQQSQASQIMLGDNLGLIVTRNNLDALQRLLPETH